MPSGYDPAVEGRCVQCGYDLAGLPDARCPECGSPVRDDTARRRWAMRHLFHRTWRGRTIAIVTVSLAAGPVAWRAGASPGEALAVGAAVSCVVAATFALGIAFTLFGPAHERALRAAIWTRCLWLPQLPWCTAGLWAALLVPVRAFRPSDHAERLAEGVWIIAASLLLLVTGAFCVATWIEAYAIDVKAAALTRGPARRLGHAAGVCAIIIGFLGAAAWSLVL